jgi:hypothetical protein
MALLSRKSFYDWSAYCLSLFFLQLACCLQPALCLIIGAAIEMSFEQKAQHSWLENHYTISLHQNIFEIKLS